MVELIKTKVANRYGNGPATTYEVRKDGKTIGHGGHRTAPFAPWTFLSADGEDYRTFKSQADLTAAF